VLSRRWSPIWRATPLLALDDFHRFEGAVPSELTAQARFGFCSVDLLPARDLAHKVAANLFAVQRGARVIYDANARNAVPGNHPTTRTLVTAASASPTPSLTSTSSQEATLVFQFGTTELLYASPTRCSTLGLYDIACVPVSVIPPYNIATDTQITWSEHLQTLHVRYPVLFPTVGSVWLCLGIESLDANKALEIMFHGFTVSDLAAKDIYEYAKVTTVWFSGCYSTDTSNIIVEFVACDDLQTTDVLHSHLLDMFMASSNPPSTRNVRPQQGSKMSKPP